MYLIARLELSYAGVLDFLAIAPKVRQKMEARGCTMLHAMISEIDRLNTVTHIWEVPDANSYFAAVEALKADPDFPEIVAALARSVVNETLSFASDAPYAPARG
ncbi:NIPSNAP family protein [Sphingobium sp. AN558]|uniref:NIPSNAP family protein n=1 Tax=Sphingobium sp. AN558 TaxID=3133442 RepID=UPI0030BFC5A2